MNEFEKNLNGFENEAAANQSEAAEAQAAGEAAEKPLFHETIVSGGSEEAPIVAEAETADNAAESAAAETTLVNVWHEDDYQAERKTEIIKTVPFTERVREKKPNMKKYVAIAVAAALVNVTALGGLFAAGYHLGKGDRDKIGKQSVIASLRKGEDGEAENGMAQTTAGLGELSTVEISKKVGPAVVGITSTIPGAMSIFGQVAQSEGAGSGIIISDDGYVVTNNHVISGASSVKVTLNTGGEYQAKIIGSDPRTDLAVIKFEPQETLTVAELGDSSSVQVGERAIAIGNPLGMEFFGSTTQGIISAINRTISVDNRTMNVLQTDAAINEGNSGGALVNAYGKVIGINAVKIASSSVEGMGFAIPISEAKPIIEDLIQHGYVKGRPVLGISSRDVTEYMSKRQGWPIGVQVMEAQIGSGAEIAGLEQGDIIFKADGKEVRNTDELNKIKNAHKPGEVMKLDVYKYSTGLNAKVNVKLSEERPE